MSLKATEASGKKRILLLDEGLITSFPVEEKTPQLDMTFINMQIADVVSKSALPSVLNMHTELGNK